MARRGGSDGCISRGRARSRLCRGTRGTLGRPNRCWRDRHAQLQGRRDLQLLREGGQRLRELVWLPRARALPFRELNLRRLRVRRPTGRRTTRWFPDRGPDSCLDTRRLIECAHDVQVADVAESRVRDGLCAGVRRHPSASFGDARSGTHVALRRLPHRRRSRGCPRAAADARHSRAHRRHESLRRDHRWHARADQVPSDRVRIGRVDVRGRRVEDGGRMVTVAKWRDVAIVEEYIWM